MSDQPNPSTSGDDRPDPTRGADDAPPWERSSAPPPPPAPPSAQGGPPQNYGAAPSDAPPPSSGGYPPPPPAGQPGYGQGYAGAPAYTGPYDASPAGRNSKALWALISGIAGLLICGVVLGPVAIVLGSQAKNEIARSGGRQTGRGMAQAGFVLGIIALALWALGLIVRFSQMGR